MPQKNPGNQKLDYIRRTLKIRRTDTSIDGELLEIIRRCNFNRLRFIAIQFGSERANALTKIKERTELNRRDRELLDNSRLVRMCKAQYNKEIRQYSFMFAALNILEDAIRQAVQESYFGVYGDNDWYRDVSKWPSWVYDKISSDQNKLSRLTTICSTPEAFLESLSFGELLAFISDESAWRNANTGALFANRVHPRTGDQLKNLSRDELDRKLSILQTRRNLIFHHKILKKEYIYRYNGAEERYSDGTPKNTINRIAEILAYLDIDFDDVMSGIGGGRYSFYRSDPEDAE